MTKTKTNRKLANLTSFFLTSYTRKRLNELFKDIKLMYKEYKEQNDDFRAKRLKEFSEDMFNSIQNEFYMTAGVSEHTIIHYEDKIDSFDEYGYLDELKVTELSDWSKFVKNLFHQEWSIEILKLIQYFNLDCQPSEYVSHFQSDFMKVKGRQDFCGTLLKWNDLIFWNPEKIHYYDGMIAEMPRAHWDNEFEAEDLNHDAILFVYEEEA